MIFNNKKDSLLSKKIVVYFVSIFYLMSVNITGAQVPSVVYDPLNVAQSTITAASSPTTAVATGASAAIDAGKSTWDIVTKNLLDYVAYSAAQNLLNQLTNSTLKWIQGGFHGSPSFAVDTDQMFTEIADNIAGNLVLQLRGIASCEFTASYRDDLANSVYIAPKKKDYIFDNQARCPFKQNWNFTATEFYAGANKLTWDAFGAMLDDGGNPYGVQTITSKELARKTADAQAKKAQETSWSNGFTDIKDLNDCAYPESIFATKDSLGKDPQYMFMLPAEREAKANELNTQMVSDPDFIRKHKEYCKTTTPGKIVGDQLTKTLGINMDRIGFADNMNKIVAAFLDQVMTKAVRGVFGTGNQAYSSGGIGDPLGGGTIGGAAACYVQVTTLSADQITSTDARINGSVTCADRASNANVSVWFRWSDAPFIGDSIEANKDLPSTNITHNSQTGQSEQFSLKLSGLLPGTKYYYSANTETSNPVLSSTQVFGQVISFTTSAPPTNP